MASGKTAIIAVLDANVLYSNFLRDVMLRLTSPGLYAPVFSERIHDEWIRNVLRNRTDLERSALERTRRLMNAIPSAILATPTKADEKQFPTVDAKDRHVAAAALVTGATHLVTSNTQDFPIAALRVHGIKRRTPDQFLVELFSVGEPVVSDTLRQHISLLMRPPMTEKEYREGMTANGLVKAERLFI